MNIFIVAVPPLLMTTSMGSMGGMSPPDSETLTMSAASESSAAAGTAMSASTDRMAMSVTALDDFMPWCI